MLDSRAEFGGPTTIESVRPMGRSGLCPGLGPIPTRSDHTDRYRQRDHNARRHPYTQL